MVFLCFGRVVCGYLCCTAYPQKATTAPHTPFQKKKPPPEMGKRNSRVSIPPGKTMDWFVSRPCDLTEEAWRGRAQQDWFIWLINTLTTL